METNKIFLVIFINFLGTDMNINNFIEIIKKNVLFYIYDFSNLFFFRYLFFCEF